MVERLFGLETEYAFTALDKNGASVSRPDALMRFMELARRRLVHLPDAASNGGMFLQNGARFYIDCGHHPEMSTPECSNPWDLVRYVRAGDHILSGLASELEQANSAVAKALFFKCNVDYLRVGTTWGCHESYLHSVDPTSLPAQITPHLVSRLIYTGAGGFNSRSPGIEFTLSPRVPYLTSEVSHESTHDRGIFHTKNESLSGHGYNRLHVLCGESVESHLAAWLKAGTTALVVAMIEAGLNPGDAVQLKRPLEAMRRFASDTECKALAEIRSGKRLSAIAIQRHYLTCAEAHVHDSFMPSWAAEVCREWRRVLDLLDKNAATLDTALDWRIKLTVFKDRAEQHGMTWEQVTQWNGVLAGLQGLLREPKSEEMDLPEELSTRNKTSVSDEVHRLTPAIRARGLSVTELSRFLVLRQQLFEIDTRYSQLGERGIFSSLDRAGVLSHQVAGVENIAEAEVNQPALGRAQLRGALVRRLEGNNGRYACDWSGVWDTQNNQMLDLSDPFETEERWKPWERETEGLSPRAQELLARLQGFGTRGRNRVFE